MGSELYGESVAGFFVLFFGFCFVCFLDGHGAFGEQCLNKYLPFSQSMLLPWRPLDSINADRNMALG